MKQQNTSTKKNSESVSKTIKTSGHGFHMQVVKELRRLGWEVEISRYFSDNYTSKPREIDIAAKKTLPIHLHSNNTGQVIEYVTVELYIECKYVKHSIVIWFDDRNEVKSSALPNRNLSLNPQQFSPRFDKHHYLSDEKVAKLSEGGNKDVFYEALNGVLNSIIFFREESNPGTHVLRYPIVVINDNSELYDAESQLLITRMFQWEVDYAYLDTAGKQKTEYFLIDVVKLYQLIDLLNTIKEVDVQALQYPLCQQWFIRNRQSGNADITKNKAV